MSAPFDPLSTPPGLDRIAWQKTVYNAAKTAAHVSASLARDAKGARMLDLHDAADDWTAAARAQGFLSEFLLGFIASPEAIVAADGALADDPEAMLRKAVRAYLRHSDDHRGDDYMDADRRAVRLALDAALEKVG